MDSTYLPAPSSSPNLPFQAADRRFSYDVKRADPIPASYLDASISLNLPPRRSMKMLKDGSDFVWPDSAHALFVKGLQAWKVLTFGSKRTRAPRGEGKTDFLVRFLHSHGVQRDRKQVASHLQVLRTEWRNLDDPVLLSLVDEAHSRSMSEPSLPPLAGSASSSSSVFEVSPDPNDDRVAPISASPHPHSPLRHALNPTYTSSSQTLPVTTTQNSTRIHSNSSPDVSASWHLVNHPSYPTWSNPPTTHPVTRQIGFSEQNTHNSYHNSSYDSPVSSHDYEENPGSLTPPSQDYVSSYYHHPASSSAFSSSSRQIPLPLPDNSPPPSAFHHVHPNPNHPYHQNFPPNTSTYVYPTRTRNDHRLMNYSAQSYTPDAGEQARRSSHPYLAGLPMAYGRSPDDPHHPDFHSPRNE